ncbi:MAG: family 2 glycosyl transferase [uncultured bacterium]|nr:MAG: family 2 glycosyl transferase [uncultured bacterium]
MNNNPLVSILIPTYNRETYLGDALNSALNQTYPNIEIIVHDDASTDNTPEVLAWYHDPRLRIIRTNNNHGMIGGWNYIVKQARGKYIKFLASDDLLDPNCVIELVKAATAHPKAALITCQRRFIDEQGRLVKKMGFANKNIVVNGKEHAHSILTTLRQNLIGEPTAVLYPTKLVKKVGGFDPQFSQFADFEYWIRLLQFGDLVYLHRTLCSFRTHAGNNTSAAMQDGRFITEIFTLIKKYCASLTPAEVDHVTRQKTLDTLKNIKDLLLEGHFLRASKYAIRLIGAISQTHR